MIRRLNGGEILDISPLARPESLIKRLNGGETFTKSTEKDFFEICDYMGRKEKFTESRD